MARVAMPMIPDTARARAVLAPGVLAASVLALILTLAGPVEPAPAAPRAASTTPQQALVTVSVATVWTGPRAPRTIDARAVSAPADPNAWLRRLGTPGRRGLHGRVETQVLFGQRLLILERRGAWAKVVVPGQPSPKSRHGYPGWIPMAQLRIDPGAATGQPTPAAATEAVVARATTWAYKDQSLRVRVVKLSYGTRLPVVATSASSVSVRAPGGRVLAVPAKVVAVVKPGSPARKVTPGAVVAEARRFLGLPYLWGGTSGFGFDCSGFTHTIYAQLGVTIPRDATPQFAVGKPIRKVANLKPGDLVFFRDRTGSIHHVGIYAGNGRMIHSPRTGSPVQSSSITTGLWAREFAGGRRFLS